MTSRSRSEATPDSPASDAIHQVLEAEARARAAIERCEAAARARVEAARAEARRIRERTTHRIVELHRTQSEKTQAQIEALQAEARERADAFDLEDGDAGVIERAAERFAAELTGGTDA
ncbi:MAG TPA: hypothetical protein RMG48_03330 [Myxococcales bacterium LLY-WYZ-16_1]|nr:hypothetical protein [Myxococcales bacterium LLY-WYZ-16_1]